MVSFAAHRAPLDINRGLSSNGKGASAFSVGDLVAYPAQGVGKIESIEHREIAGVTDAFYIVRILNNSITLMVPVTGTHNVKLRALTDISNAETVLTAFFDHSAFSGYSGQNWNRRCREYTERLKNNELADVANVLHELLLIGKNKELSFGERRLMEQAMSLVCGELAIVLGTPERTLRSRIQEIFVTPPEENP